MSDKIVVGLNMAETVALRRILYELDLDRGVADFMGMTREDAVKIGEMDSWITGRIVTKLDNAMPITYYYMKMPDNLDTPEMFGPFATQEAMLFDGFDKAYENNWPGIVWHLIPLSPTLEASTFVIHRDALEKYWTKHKKGPFVSQISGDLTNPGGVDETDEEIQSAADNNDYEPGEDYEEDEDCYEEDEVEENDYS